MEHKDALVALEARKSARRSRNQAGKFRKPSTLSVLPIRERRLYGQTVNSELPEKELFTYRRPLGVCGIINACNFPSAVPFGR